MVEPSTLRNAIDFLDRMGVLNVLLPFFFVFVIVFGVLEKTKVLGTREGRSKKNINAMVSFVLAFLFITSLTQVQALTTYLQILAMGLVFIISFFFVVAAFTGKVSFEKTTYVFALALIFAVIAFLYALGLWNNEKLRFIFDLILNPVVIVAVLFFFIVLFITYEGKKEGGVKKAEEEVKKHAKPSGEIPR
jgi:hypothetical protein